jgi:hypothetical protein
MIIYSYAHDDGVEDDCNDSEQVRYVQGCYDFSELLEHTSSEYVIIKKKVCIS